MKKINTMAIYAEHLLVADSKEKAGRAKLQWQ